MLRMPLGQVTPGMTLAAPVANPKQPEYDLLKAGFELTSAMIDRLREIGVRTLWIAYPSLDFLDESVGGNITGQQQQVYQGLKKSFTATQERVVARIDFQEYRRTLSQLIQAIAAQKADTLMVDPLLSDNGDLFLHCSNVCYLSLMLGVKLGHYLVQQRMRLDPRHARDVMNLGLGALLHDVGKIRINAQLRAYEPTPGKTAPPDWQLHTEYGFEMIRGKVEPSASQVAMHHHQRWDGQGFPPLDSTGRPLAGERIHVFSRIVCVANCYERLLTQAVAQGLPTVAVMKQMRGRSYRGMFDPVVLKAFSDLVPPFPIGSLVGLNEGGQAVVLIHNPDDPCRPTVRRLPDNLANSQHPSTSFEGEDIDLSQHDELSIVSAEGLDAEPFLFDAWEGISKEEAGNKLLMLS